MTPWDLAFFSFMSAVIGIAIGKTIWGVGDGGLPTPKVKLQPMTVDELLAGNRERKVYVQGAGKPQPVVSWHTARYMGEHALFLEVGEL